MPKLYSVAVPPERKFSFPDRCVWCGKSAPGHQHRHLSKKAFTGRYTGWSITHVPCCRGCAWSLQFSQIARFALLLLMVAALMAVFVALFLLIGLRGDNLIGGSGVATLVSAIALIMIDPLPPRFRVRIALETCEVSYRDPRLAKEFAEHNGLAQLAPEARHADSSRVAP